MATLKEVERLEREALLAYIEDERDELNEQIHKATPLAERIRQMNVYYAARRAGKPQYGVYRAQPTKITPLRTQRFEYKGLKEGQSGYEAEQRRLDALWRAERRAKGLPVP